MIIPSGAHSWSTLSAIEAKVVLIFRDAVQPLIANRRAELPMREIAPCFTRPERNFTPVRGGRVQLGN
jgi:hypothetical protein